ncbi:hypothetical protein LG311_17885 [Sutcliffiella horikoshii]|uniref:hypothetical protein n=1 Tax=Sutcliffiella horikoshii TaxID=79883 RepID=UPI00384CFF07
MEKRYKLYDSADKTLYIGVDSNYFKLNDAKNIYKKSTNSESEDDSILIQIAKDKASEVEAEVTFGVEEGERFALALLNLCSSIKR